MKMKRKFDSRHGYLFSLLLVFFVTFLIGCKDDDKSGTIEPYDPSRSVSISDFVPKSGSVGQQLVIFGDNFGNDTSLVKVTIGGKKAVLVNVHSNALYCYVPSKSYTGEIVVTVGDKTVQASEKFNYQRKMVVGKLCGYKNERDDQGWVEGPFTTCSGFANDGVMQFSPYNHDQLFIVYDGEPNWRDRPGIQLLDLKEKTVKTVLPWSMFNSERLRTIDFAVDPFQYDEEGHILGRSTSGWRSSSPHELTRWSEHLVIAADNYDSNWRAHSVYIVDRDSKGEFSSESPHRLLACYNQCNGASIHPNGELYFTSYTQGEVLRLDMEKYWESVENGEEWNPNAKENLHDISTDESTGTGAFERLYTVQDTGWEFQIDINPTGKYAYIVVINRNYILRTDYNESTHRFSAPYQVAGQMKNAGFVDGVGKSAMVNRPYQGTFVKNDAYVKEGRSDIYDFYFCDSQNNAIRYLTPEGIVSTYAGGGATTHADGNTYGNENGELRDVARFNRCTGLVNDVHTDAISGEKTLIFYILDTENRCIRTITMEGSEDDGTTVPAGTSSSAKIQSTQQNK
jgi:hypothetical protein